jgi:hypothetical protein
VSARRLVLAAAAILALGLATAAPAQELAVSAAAGGFFPSGYSYDLIYGRSLVLAGDVWFKFRGPFGLATGFSYLSDQGTAIGTGGEEYVVDFRRRTVPLILFYQLDFGPVGLRAGAGLGFHSVRETWRTVDLDFSGTKTAPRVLLGVSVRVAGPVSFVTYASYDFVRLRKDDYSDAVDIGGVQVLGGLSVKIF